MGMSSDRRPTASPTEPMARPTPRQPDTGDNTTMPRADQAHGKRKPRPRIDPAPPPAPPSETEDIPPVG